MKKVDSTIRKGLIIAVSIIISLNTNAQKSIPFITNYSLPVSMSPQNFQIIQGDNNTMYILNQNGVFSFDGYAWERMPITGQAMAITYLDKLFVGGDQELGFFKKNVKGIYVYSKIEQQKPELYYLFYHFNNNLYAAGVDGIYRIKRAEPHKVEVYYTEKDSDQIITDMFNIGDKFFIIKNRTSIFQIHKQDANLISTNIKNEEFVFSIKHNETQILGTSSNKIFQFDGVNLKPIFIKDQRYIDASYVTNALSIDDKTIAISTLIGGCIIINIENGETKHIINYTSGLPDDEVTTMGKDNWGGLWLIHGMGISRVDLNLPIGSYHHIGGLKGNILSVSKLSGDLYIGTSDGVYKLTESKSYDSKTITITAKPAKEQKTNSSQETRISENNNQTTVTPEKKKKGLFSRLFGKERIEPSNVEVVKEEPVLSDEKNVEVSTQKAIVRKRVSQLVSTDYKYEKTSGISGKINHLVNWNGNLMVSSSTGLYSITKGQPISIIGNEYIYCLNPGVYSKSLLFAGTWEKLYKVSFNNNRWESKKIIEIKNEKITSVVEIAENALLISTDYKVYRINEIDSSNPSIKQVLSGENKLISPVIRKANNNFIVITPSQIFQYHQQGDSIGIYNEFASQGNFKALYSGSNQTWLRSGQHWYGYPSSNAITKTAKYLGLFDRVNFVNYNDSNEVWVVNNYNQIYKITPTIPFDSEDIVSIYIKQVIDKTGRSLNTSYVKLESTNNSFKIKLGAPFYLKEKSVEYQYLLEGVMSEWSDWGNTPEKDFPFFPPGDHVLKFRARDAMGNLSKVQEYKFSITPPFYQTIWFYLLVIAFVIAFVTIFIRLHERNLIKEKQILEQKVKERTKTIEEQKNAIEHQRDELQIRNQEILQQKEEIEAQRDEITSQRDQIISQNQDIIKSISYARRIQNAVMPSKDVADSILNNYFILLKPRDIVSGDFFWMTKKNDKIIVTAADCTGHGVPGAFMSLMGITLLTEIVKNTDDIKPNIILNSLRMNIKRALSQVGKEHEAKDGMDIALCVIDTKANTLMFAGAYNPLYLVRNSELIEFKGDKMPVGVHINEKESFTLHEIALQKNDCIYMFSDGYVDQFGGNDNRKFMSRNFKELLLKVSSKEMAEQKLILDDTIDQWIGPHDQLDDILVMGIRI